MRRRSCTAAGSAAAASLPPMCRRPTTPPATSTDPPTLPEQAQPLGVARFGSVNLQEAEHTGGLDQHSLIKLSACSGSG